MESGPALRKYKQVFAEANEVKTLVITVKFSTKTEMKCYHVRLSIDAENVTCVNKNYVLVVCNLELRLKLL